MARSPLSCSARIALLGLGLLGSTAAPVSAAPERPFGLRGPFDLVAEEVEYERTRQLYVARGDVRITQGERTLRADWVSLSNATRVGVASGNVVVTQGDDVLHAAFLQFDVETLEGVLYDGRLDSARSRFRLEGSEVRRTGADTYRFERARFTTCRCPDPGRDPWSIRAEQADLELGGYGTARNTTFDVLGLPVLWLPWMVYPLKTERQTGFLFPEVSATSVSGGDFALPFFWAVGESVNLTLTPAYLSKRGFKARGELEYVFGERSEGSLLAAFVPNDTDIDPDDPETPFERQRWAAEWLHDQFLPAEWRFKVDARAVSDNLYPFDFEELSSYWPDRFLESTGFVERHFGRFRRLGLTGAVDVADDLQNPDDLDRDDFLLQRLPELTLSALPRGFGWLPRVVGSLDVLYTNFQPADRAGDDLPEATVIGDHLFLDTGIEAIPDGRERDATGARVAGDGSLDNFDPLLNPSGFEGDGRFQEGEPLADAGQRLELAPRLALPLRLGDLLELYPEVGYYGTLYQTREQGFEQRSLVTGRLDVRGRLRRAFAGGTAVHVVEPRLGWAVVSQTSQSAKPLFVPRTALPQQRVRELELTSVTRDPADRIESFNGVVLGFTNRVFRQGPADGIARLWADVTLSAQYDFSGSEFGFVVLDGRASPLDATQLRFHVSYDADESRLAEALLGFGWSHDAGHELGLGYRYLREIPRFYEAFLFDDERFDDFEEDFDRVNQISFAARAALGESWALTYRGVFSFESSLTLANQAGLEYVSKCRCWAIRFEIEDERERGFGFGIRYRLIGLGDDRSRPFGSGRGLARAGGLLDAPGDL